MKKRRMLAAAIVMLALFGGGAAAEGKYKTITAYFERIVIEMNGQKLGESGDSLVYNGAIYVPVQELADMLGAETAWNASRSTLSLDFLHEGSENALAAAVESGIYQYAALENNAILKALVDNFKADDMAAAKRTIARYEALKNNLLGIPDEEAARYVGKMKAAAELMRSGWSAKKFDNYAIAWTIYQDNAERLHSRLRSRIEDLSLSE